MENRMMIDDEIEMMQANIDNKKELQCKCIDKLERVAGGVKNLDEVGNAQEQTESVEALLDNVKKETHLVEEENKKLKAVCIKVKKQSLEINEELKDLRIKNGKQKQEISALKAQITNDKGKHEEKVQNMKKSFEKDKTDLKSLSRSKLEEEAIKTKELVAKHKQLVEVLSDKIECPVCLEVPRAGPVPVCPNGHFVCKGCKKTTCPSCRVPMGNGKSLLATAVLERIDHRCKFDDCEKYFALDKLDDHEKVCLLRTVSCPYPNCTEQIALTKLRFHLSSSSKCCPNSGPTISAKNSLVVTERYGLEPEVIESKNLFYPVHLFSLDGYDLCIFPGKDAGNFYFSCVMFTSKAVCSQYKIEMAVQAEESPLDSEVSFKFCGKPSSIDEDYNETKHYGLVVSAKAMGKISKKDNDFYISLSVKKM